jgi:adenosylcobinamide kinase/adenosylcobinamide-phosphate guanylyltransferase
MVKEGSVSRPFLLARSDPEQMHEQRNQGLSHFVIGGARSGKTRYGLTLAEQSKRQKWMIVTAQETDDEMKERIALHRAERDETWNVIEEPRKLVGVLGDTAHPDRVVVVDCLTLWLSNLFLVEADFWLEIKKLADLLRLNSGQVVLISNELGLGLAPDNPLGRAFRDAHGRMNQVIASSCDAVTFVAAGLPLSLK